MFIEAKSRAKGSEAWTLLCDEVTIVENGVMTCLTLPADIGLHKIRVVDKTRKWQHAKSQGANIKYKQTFNEWNPSPVVNKAVIEGTPANIIRFKGKGFRDAIPSKDAVVTGHFRGHVASEVSVTDTEAVVYFLNGVPLTLEDDKEVPHLHFVWPGNNEVVALHADDFAFARPAVIFTGQVVLNNLSAAREVTCSFAGGCDYTIIAEGLRPSLMDTENNRIEVCGNTCELSAEIEEGRVTCTVAPLVTKYSVDNFAIAVSSVLEG